MAGQTRSRKNATRQRSQTVRSQRALAPAPEPEDKYDRDDEDQYDDRYDPEDQDERGYDEDLDRDDYDEPDDEPDDEPEVRLGRPIRPEVLHGEIVTHDVTSHRHVLELSGDRFVGSSKFPTTPWVRFASDPFKQMNRCLELLIDPRDHERMWDAFEREEVEGGDPMKVVRDFFSEYQQRPTRSRTSSRGGRDRTGRR